MIDPIYVTAVAERRPQYRGGVSFTLDGALLDENTGKKWLAMGGKWHYTFPNLKAPGVHLISPLIGALKERDWEAAEAIRKDVEKYAMKNPAGKVG